MGFLAPWFLAGALAVGLPVFVHLLRKQTTEPRPVSSLMFFEQGTQSSTRHRRLRYYLLFALRTLLVLLLALAFAQPFIRHKTVMASDKLLLVVIDDSFSMNAAAGPGETRLDEAKRGALAVLAGKAGAQKAQVIALGGQMRVLTQPIEDLGALRAAVQGIGPGDGHGNFGELGRGMRAMAETVHTPMELDLFSDMQSSNMPGNFADMVMPGNVALVLHPVSAKAVPNWTVESVEAPGQLVDTKKARVLAVVAGHGTPAATRTVSLMVNGNVVTTKKLDVPANGRATVVFEGLDVPYGESRCAVKIDAADGFANDDASGFAVKRADPERVLFVHQATDTRSPLYFGAALAAAAQASFVLQSITPDQAADIDPTKYAFVVLSDVAFVPSLLENTLLRNVQDGGSVLVAAGTAESHREHIPVYGGNAQDGHYYARGSSQDAAFATVGLADGSHPSMKDANGWAGTKFYYAAKIDPGNARVVARLADGTPLLMDKQMGEGHVLVFASGFDNVTNDLPLSPAFVAFVDRTARYLSGEERAGGARVVDSFVQLRNPANEKAGANAGLDGGCDWAGWEAAAVVEGGGCCGVVSAGEGGVLPGAVCEWAGCADCGESGSAGVGYVGDSGRCIEALEWQRGRGRGGGSRNGGGSEKQQCVECVVVGYASVNHYRVGRVDRRQPVPGYAAGGSMSKRQQLNLYIRQVQQRLRLDASLRGAAVIAFVALVATVILTLILNAYAFPENGLTPARLTLLAIVVAAVCFGLAWPLWRLTWRRSVGRAESGAPEFEQRLVTFSEKEKTGEDGLFLELLAGDTLKVADSDAARPAGLVPQKRLAVLLTGAVVCAGVLVWMVAARPGFMGYGASLLWTGPHKDVPPIYEIHVSPGNAAVRRNSDQMVTAQVVGLTTNKVNLYAKYASTSKWEPVAMQPESGGAGFEFLFAGLPENVEYYVEAGAAKSKHFKFRVVDLPAVKQIQVTYHYPKWTGMQTVSEEHGGDLRALEGTDAELTVTMTSPLKDGMIVLDGGQPLKLKGGEGNKYTGTIHMDKDGAYHVAAEDEGQQGAAVGGLLHLDE